MVGQIDLIGGLYKEEDGLATQYLAEETAYDDDLREEEQGTWEDIVLVMSVHETYTTSSVVHWIMKGELITRFSRDGQ